MGININRKKRHVTISMPRYIEKLLQSIRPNGMKAASTPATYCPPNFKNPGAQTATIDETPEASKEQKHELQSVIDPSICTAVHALGSIQAKPTIKDMQKWNDYFNTYPRIRTMESDITHRTCSYKDNLTLPT